MKEHSVEISKVARSVDQKLEDIAYELCKVRTVAGQEAAAKGIPSPGDEHLNKARGMVRELFREVNTIRSRASIITACS